MRHLLNVLCLAAGATACGDLTGTSFFAPSSVQLRSDPGDPVGAGKTYTYTQANAVFGFELSGNGQIVPVTLTVSVQGDESWRGFFTMPSGKTRLEPGTYQEDPRWHAVIACNTTGSFTIDRVSYAGPSLTAIDLSFEQQCAGVTAALHGTVHWRASDATRAPGPVNPPPATLWRPPAGATPAGVNFVYLQSDSGDVVGHGRTDLYTPATATLDVVGYPGHVYVGVAGADTSSGDFLKMNSIPKLTVGYYGGLQGLPSMNPAKGGLTWGICGVLTGWFVIDHVTYSADTVTAIDLRFEQHCQASPTAALHGAVHWTR